MFKKYVAVFIIIGLFSLFSLADEPRTYKDEIPTLLTYIGEHPLVSIPAYKVNKKDGEFLPSESKSIEVLNLDTSGDLSKFEYYLRSDGNIISRMSYGNNKVYKIDILIEAINSKTQYRYPSYVRSVERQSDFYKHDLVEYLNKNGWNNNELLENEYEKDGFVLKITHSPDYALILEMTNKTLITELNNIKIKHDEYEENDTYIKEVYSGLITIDEAPKKDLPKEELSKLK